MGLKDNKWHPLKIGSGSRTKPLGEKNPIFEDNENKKTHKN